MNTASTDIHVPVLLREVVATLAPCLQAVPEQAASGAGRGARYLDGTLGLAGHARALLAAGGADTTLCGLDRDAEALELARERLHEFAPRVHLFHSRYSEFAEALDSLEWPTVDAVLIDIGVSSLQIDNAERGFSFHADGPLDMRMNQQNPAEEPVSKLVNRARQEELKDIIIRYGEEPQAGRIAAAIVRARHEKAIETTLELAHIVEQAYPAAWRAKARNHPATRTFQALRMAVNDEIGELERFLDAILPRLRPGGRLAVIAFHSLEDRVVKHRFKAFAQGCVCPHHVPVCVCGHSPEAVILTPRPITASAEELAVNPRASSAKLRVIEKLDAPTRERGLTAVTEQAPRGKNERLRAREEKMRRLGHDGSRSGR